MHATRSLPVSLVPLAPGLRIAALPDAFLARVRSGVDDLGQAVEHHVALGGEPLRDCLRRAEPGEAILLASYCPFTVAGPYKEYGPVFVAASAQAMPCLDALPLHGDRPYLGASFVLRAYSRDERIVDACLSSPQDVAGDLDTLFAQQETVFVLARFAAYGCYGLRVERVPASSLRPADVRG